MHERGGWYYLSYATEFPEKIAHARSRLAGPWQYKGILNELAGNSNTNHQAITDFKGKSYFIYYNGGMNAQGGSFRRSVCIDYLHYNPDDTLQRVQINDRGGSPRQVARRTPANSAFPTPYKALLRPAYT